VICSKSAAADSVSMDSTRRRTYGGRPCPLLTGWSLVRSRPGEPFIFKILTGGVNQEKPGVGAP
jgi:hypothetical protein